MKRIIRHKKIVEYQCSKCGAISDNKEDIKRCEATPYKPYGKLKVGDILLGYDVNLHRLGLRMIKKTYRKKHMVFTCNHLDYPTGYSLESGKRLDSLTNLTSSYKVDLKMLRTWVTILELEEKKKEKKKKEKDESPIKIEIEECD